MVTLTVELGAHRYPVRIAPGLLGDHTALASAIHGHQLLVVSNTTVAPLYLPTLQPLLDHYQWQPFLLPDGEAHKTFDNVARVLGALAEFGASRDASVLALGGGVVGDLAGFAAALWMRGIDCVQLPTTLLAMVDASVGGKTGVNLPQGKNLIGAFHQPRAVFIDPLTLATLPNRELCAGLAEIVKMAAIADPVLFDWLEQNAAALRARDLPALTHAITTSVGHKARIVAADEHEHGERALLNFGHSFGHAIESATTYTRFLHGEAVAIGMLVAARLSAHLGLADGIATERLARLLAALGLPTKIPPELHPEQLIGLLQLDKKVLAGQLRLILWRGIGRAEVVAGTDHAAIRQSLLDSR